MPSEPTNLLKGSSAGEPLAAEALAPLVYEELHRLASAYLRAERPDHTLQPTALVNEALVRLFDDSKLEFNDRNHFTAVAATAMRRILINHARDRARLKRGGGAGGGARLPLPDDLAGKDQMGPQIAELDDLVRLEVVLTRLEALDPSLVRLVELRFFAGLSLSATAAALGVSTATVSRQWALARAWILREMSPPTDSPPPPDHDP